MKKNSVLFILAIGIIFIIGLKTIPHAANFAPIAAITLFSSVYLKKGYQSLLLSIGGLLICDIIMEINQSGTGFYAEQGFVYGSYALINFYGLFIKKSINLKIVAVSPFVTTGIFFIVSNFGSWIMNNIYPHTFSGFIANYIGALPFVKNTFISDLVFIPILFGAYYLVNKKKESVVQV